MLIEEFAIVLGAGFIATIGSLLIVARFSSSPIAESKLFILGSVLFTLYFYCVLPVTILGDHKTAVIFIKIAPFFAHTGLFILSLSILLPTLSTNNTNYKNIAILIFLSILMTSAVIINYQTISFTISTSNYVVISYQTSLSFALLVANGLSYIMVLVIRIRSVIRIFHSNQVNQDRYILKFRFLAIYIFLVIITLASLILNRTFEPGSFPGFSWFIPISIDYLYLSYSIYQDESFLFITTSKLEGIMISENKNNFVVFSNYFVDSSIIESDDLFANILNAFNLSLKTKINTKKNLEQIIYGDKIIISYYGELVTTFLIVTQNNLITQSIAKYINSKFEKKFKTKLLEFKESGIMIPQYIKGFDDEISYVRSFIPL